MFFSFLWLSLFVSAMYSCFHLFEFQWIAPLQPIRPSVTSRNLSFPVYVWKVCLPVYLFHCISPVCLKYRKQHSGDTVESLCFQRCQGLDETSGFVVSAHCHSRDGTLQRQTEMLLSFTTYPKIHTKKPFIHPHSRWCKEWEALRRAELKEGFQVPSLEDAPALHVPRCLQETMHSSCSPWLLCKNFDLRCCW